MDKQKRWLFSFGKLVTMPALFLWVLLAGSMTAYAAEYELYIGSTQVNDTNKDDIFEDGTASYDPDTATLYLKGVSIGEGNSHFDEEFGDGYNYSLYSGTDVVKNLVIEGNNSFVSTGPTGNGMLFKVMGPTVGDNDYAKHSLMITGSGTLTSTVDGDDDYDCIAAMTVVGEVNSYGGNGKGGVFMGNTDGTGPRLELTGLRRGANFYDTGRVQMQGGTIIAKATGTPGTGVTFPVISPINGGGETYFNGGTIAGYGTAGVDTEENEYSGAFEGSGDVQWSALGMQCVYEAPEENDYGVSGWVVFGMTEGDHVADSQTVLSELSLDSSGGDSGGDSGGGTDPTNPGGTGEGGGTDPTNPDTPGTDPTNPGTDPTNPDNPGTEGNRYHTDMVPEPDVVDPKFGTDIDVQGYTKNTTVYSVDVEWGAMTFQYEKSSWDPESHTSKPGKGWVVYDNVNDKVLDSKQDAINKITVTNRSNAEVYATLSYAGNNGYADIGGGFTKSTEDAATAFTPAADPTPAYLTLATAKNGLGEGGANQETVGTVYFMPNGIGTVNDISQWTVIGKITVGLQTEEPTEEPTGQP